MTLFGDPPGTFPVFDANSQFKVSSIYDIDPLVLGDLAAYFSANLSQLIPDIAQVPGYSAQTPYSATPVNTEETTSSTTYVDLTTVGPSLTGLPDGKYTITWGAASKSSSPAIRSKMSVSLNGAAVDNTMQAYTLSTSLVGVSYQTAQTIQGQTGGNSIVCKYAMGAVGATGMWGGRYLLAIRISGP